MIDFYGQSRKFLGGESHAATSLMAERLWEKIDDIIIQFLLDLNAGYELIVTGHSLGGGSTYCVNLTLHHDGQRGGTRVPQLCLRCTARLCAPLQKSPRHKLASTISTRTMLYHSCAATQFATK
jgi:hypothetical protein